MTKLQRSTWASCLVLFTVFFALAQAFPSVENLSNIVRRSGPPSDHDISARVPGATEGNERRPGSNLKPGPPPPVNDVAARLVDVTGDHAFQAPGAGDQRGPCPGLNALANHGYISRDGVTSLVDAVTAATVLGMGADIAGVLATLSTIYVGNPLSLDPSFSIGGKSSKVSNALGNLLGLLDQPAGVDASHNLLETDASGTRDDLYVTGNAWTMDMDHFEAMINTGSDVLTMDNAYDFAMTRFQDSIASNPYFYYGPATGILIRNGGFVLPPRIMSNFSAEHLPDGQLTKENLMSFYGVTTDNGKMVYNVGHEQIPANFFRRPTDYTLIDFNLDIIALVAKYPELASIGGNTGTVNSFAGVDMDNVSGGLLGATSILQGNNMMCFVLQAVKSFVPQTLSSLFSVLEAPLQLLDQAVAPLSDLGCPAFSKFQMDGTDLYSALLSKYPGAKRSGYAL